MIRDRIRNVSALTLSLFFKFPDDFFHFRRDVDMLRTFRFAGAALLAMGCFRGDVHRVVAFLLGGLDIVDVSGV